MVFLVILFNLRQFGETNKFLVVKSQIDILPVYLSIQRSGLSQYLNFKSK